MSLRTRSAPVRTRLRCTVSVAGYWALPRTARTSPKSSQILRWIGTGTWSTPQGLALAPPDNGVKRFGGQSSQSRAWREERGCGYQESRRTHAPNPSARSVVASEWWALLRRGEQRTSLVDTFGCKPTKNGGQAFPTPRRVKQPQPATVYTVAIRRTWRLHRQVSGEQPAHTVWTMAVTVSGRVRSSLFLGPGKQ